MKAPQHTRLVTKRTEKGRTRMRGGEPLEVGLDTLTAEKTRLVLGPVFPNARPISQEIPQVLVITPKSAVLGFRQCG